MVVCFEEPIFNVDILKHYMDEVGSAAGALGAGGGPATLVDTSGEKLNVVTSMEGSEGGTVDNAEGTEDVPGEGVGGGANPSGATPSSSPLARCGTIVLSLLVLL